MRGNSRSVSSRPMSHIASAYVLSQIARDRIIEGTLDLPETLECYAVLLERFSSLCHSVNQTMLSCLSDALKLDDASRFENSHRDDRPSDSALNLIYAPTKRKRTDVADTTHTDSGTLTLLFCDQWGIMMEHPETKAWTFVEPKPWCALINVADFLQSLSGNKLHSCRHCVSQPVDGFQSRYYIVSYLRPEKA
jgi:isopenicillin N synthase-like dioxygenase